MNQRLSSPKLAVWLLAYWCALHSPLALSSSGVHGGLDPEHSKMAGLLADDLAWSQLRNAATVDTHPLGIQTLFIERDEGKKGDTHRRARVYQFNYLTQQSRVVLVDIASQTVEKVQTINSVHLPLNEAEISQARILIESDSAIMRQLNQIQGKKGLTALNDLSTIEVKASIYEPDNAEHRCEKQRCALISMFDQTRTVFTLEPVVNLQTSSVTTLEYSE